MKTSHKNIKLIENWLDKTNKEILLEDNFIREVYEEVLEKTFKVKDIESIKHRKRAYTYQYDFVRRDLLKIKYKKNNNSSLGIKEGFVYCIGNPAWRDYVKIGSAIDVYDRLSSYQTGSPYRDYHLIDYYFSHNRLLEESNLHKTFDERNSEWCKVSQIEIKEIFKILKEKNSVEVLPEKLLEKKKELFLDHLNLTRKTKTKIDETRFLSLNN